MLSKKEYWKKIITKSRLPLSKNYNILEIGFGDGAFAKKIANKVKSVTGIGIEKELPKNMPKNVTLKIIDAEKMPFKDNYFDLVFTKDTLHHIKNLGLVFDEIRRVLKKDKKIIIIEANRYNPIFYVNTTKIAGHNHFSTGYLKQLLKNHGFNKYKHFFIHTRDYRINNKILHKIIRLYENFVENTPLIRAFATYNVFHIKNQK